jgi:hypothetical protein
MLIHKLHKMIAAGHAADLPAAGLCNVARDLSLSNRSHVRKKIRARIIKASPNCLRVLVG